MLAGHLKALYNEVDMSKHVFTGFGFGPIQSGLFVKEAFASGNFERIVVAEINQSLVDAVRAGEGSYHINVAHADGVEVVKIENLEVYNPNVAQDRVQLIEALRASTEIVTSLPAVNFFDTGGPTSVATMIAESRMAASAEATLIYTAENNNHAAEILQDIVHGKMSETAEGPMQFLNTVIGKMSRIVTDAEEVKQLDLKPISPGIDQAFLVETFNHILVTKCTLDGFRPGIEVFVEKDDLIPFEEAKLYGHNAIHALLAYLGALKGLNQMTELKDKTPLMHIGREAFLNESGAALIKKYQSLNDPLFTSAGYEAFADDLLERMTNPYLQDTTQRAGRDPVRKLSYSDRICGTMALALDHGITPINMALGLMAGLAELLKHPRENNLPAELQFGDWRQLKPENIMALVAWLHAEQAGPHSQTIAELAVKAHPDLIKLMST